jgi:hypothetical protein
MFGGGSAAHASCDAADTLRRALNALSPEAMADEAEVTLRGDAT